MEEREREIFQTNVQFVEEMFASEIDDKIARPSRSTDGKDPLMEKIH